MFSAIAALVGLFGLGPQGPIEEQRLDLQGWRITVSQDRFTGAVSCRAARRDMSLTATAVVFRFGRHVDTSKAVYRLDEGPAYAVADEPVNQDLRHIAEVGAPLENPSAGFVALPVARLASIKRVDIRPNIKSPPQSFDVSGVPAVLRLEQAKSCFSGSDQQRPTLTATPTPASPPR
jgi:hypothetical protein